MGPKRREPGLTAVGPFRPLARSGNRDILLRRKDDISPVSPSLYSG